MDPQDFRLDLETSFVPASLDGVSGGEVAQNVSLSPVILWTILILFALIFIVYTILLAYHWRQYEWHNRATRKSALIYAICAVVFFGTQIFIIGYLS